MTSTTPGSLHLDFGLLQQLAVERDFGRLFEMAAEAATRTLGADGAALIKLIGGDQLKYCFFQGMPKCYERLAQGYSFSTSQGTAGAAIRLGEPVFTPDYANSPQAIPEFVKAGLRANLAIPIGPNDDRRGVLAVAWFEDSPPASLTESELVAACFIADLIYGAMYRQSLQDELAREARYDSLTGLPNRRHFMEALQSSVSSAHDANSGFAVVVIDLNSFKPINDTFGHNAGDQVLAQFSTRLKGETRNGDLAGRFGGDEFALILNGIAGIERLATLLNRLGKVFDQRYLIDNGSSIICSVSIGAALFPVHGGDPELLLRNADQAMYRAKSRKNPRSCVWEIYDATLGSTHKPHVAATILPGKVEVHFQPVFNMRRMCVVRVEALARLRRNRRLMLPYEFLPDLGPRQLLRLFDEVLEFSLASRSSWHALGHGIDISVNVEPESLIDPNFVERLRKAITAGRAHPSQVTLELLEHRELLSEVLTQENLARINELGVRLAVDDVGSAYSSLLRLRNLPIHEIKLDQIFAREIGKRLQDIAFVHSIHDLSRSLHIGLVVEGVESPDGLNILSILGVEEVQGYVVARPAPSTEIPAVLSRLATWTLPKGTNVLANSYAMQLASESHVLGLLKVAPQLLSVDCITHWSMGELGELKRLAPKVLELHEQQKILLHDMIRHHESDLSLPILRFRKLGAKLRQLLASIAT